MIPVKRELSIPAVANKRYSDLSLRELNKGWRVIGGDRGDLYFKGFHIDNDRTVLDDPHLFRVDEDLTEDEVGDIAEEILMASYESIGAETVEHS